jgi:hypothetical protein
MLAGLLLSFVWVGWFSLLASVRLCCTGSPRHEWRHGHAHRLPLGNSALSQNLPFVRRKCERRNRSQSACHALVGGVLLETAALGAGARLDRRYSRRAYHIDQ